MPRFNLYRLSPQEQVKLLDRFFIAVASLGSLNEVKSFFKDLLHPQEITMLARRLKIAEMLFGGETHEEIARKLGAGPVTITKIHRWVNSDRGGYKTVVSRLKKLDNRYQRRADKESKARNYYGWERFKKIYPTLDADNIQDLLELIEDYIRRNKRRGSLMGGH